MIQDQDSFVGHRSDKQFSKVILSSNSQTAIQDYRKFLELFSTNGIDFRSITGDNIQKFGKIFKDVMEGDNVVLKKEVYAQFLSSRFNKESVSVYEENLRRFKELINNENATETMMQNFLSDKVWFFGLNYVQSAQNSKPKFNATLGTEYDFLLEGFNQVYDIAELKGPNEPLFDVEKEGKRKSSFNDRIDYKFSAKFSRALHQVMSYMNEFEENFNHIQDNQPSIKDFMYPKGTIIMSKRSLFPDSGKNSEKYLHLINRQFANIDILTYDDLADRAQIIIDFIKK
jgi:hypothetical protein